MTYEQMPLKLFFRLMERGDAVAERAIGKGVWRKIREQWELNSQDSKGEVLLEARRNVVITNIRVNKIKTLVDWTKATEDYLQSLLVLSNNAQLNDFKNRLKDVYRKLGLTWLEEGGRRKKELDKFLSKESQKLRIFKAQLQNLENNEDDEEESEFSLAKLNEAIASLEMHGFNIPDYNELTLSKYEGMTRSINEKINRQKLSGATG